MQNPFKYGQIVDKDDFCAPPHARKTAPSPLQVGPNVVILGERRVGKSSLIHHAAAKSRGKRLLYIDLWGIKTEEDLLKRAIYGLSGLEDSDPLASRLLKAFSGLRLSIGMSTTTGSPHTHAHLCARKRQR